MNRVKEARLSVGLKQNELAERIQVGKSTVCEWESQKRDPKSDMLMRLADVCGCTTDYLLCKENRVSNNEHHDEHKTLSPESIELAEHFEMLNLQGKYIVKEALFACERAGLVLTSPVPRPEEE